MSVTLYVLAVSCVCHGREYRVDSQAEFNRISAVQLSPGDSVLLKRGVIHVHIKKLRRARFEDLRITNNRIEHVGGV